MRSTKDTRYLGGFPAFLCHTQARCHGFFSASQWNCHFGSSFLESSSNRFAILLFRWLLPGTSVFGSSICAQFRLFPRAMQTIGMETNFGGIRLLCKHSYNVTDQMVQGNCDVASQCLSSTVVVSLRMHFVTSDKFRRYFSISGTRAHQSYTRHNLHFDL